MTNNLFLLRDVGDFAPGAFENTAVEDGSVQLGRSGGAYLQSGSYTSPPFKAGAFLRLLPSWNASTPHGTAVEVQARIASGGKWSRWLSFGKWSPFITRSSPQKQEDDIATAGGGILSLNDGMSPADMVQVRIFLYSDDKARSPKVQLLGISVDPLRREREDASRTQRMLQLPTYSCLVRDPSIAGHIATPTTLSMLMNRWGEDTLPEEVARAAYDYGQGSYNSLAFATAIAGAYGYECFVRYGGIELLRQEVRRGNAVGALVHYRAPSLGEANGQKPAPRHASLPVLEDAAADSTGHLVAIRGFSRKNNEEWIALNDPMARSDAEVLREMPVSQFGEIYTGTCMLLHKGPKGAGHMGPERLVGELTLQDGKLSLSAKGENIYPGKLTQEDDFRFTVCYTLPEGVAHASAAQKKFYYLAPDESGHLHFDPATAAGKKTAFYFIGSQGQTWVAEKTLAAAEPPQTTQEGEN